MWRTANVTTSSLKIGVFALAFSLIFGSSLAAQDSRDRYPDRDRDAYGGVPDRLTIPVGTTIVGQLSQYLSSHQNRPGDGFTMTLDQPIIVNGWVVARKGQMVTGEVSVANKGGIGKGPSQLGVELTELTLVDGQQVPIYTQLVQTVGPSSTGRNVATVATTTGLGTVIGAAADGGRGAGIGAGIGAAAGVIGVLVASGRPSEILPESMMTFRLTAPVNISTEGSERAFLPVSPQDYGRSANTRAAYAAPPRPAVRPYPPYPYPYVYAAPYPYVIAPRVTIVRPIHRGWGRRW
jgi:hypothetical protein